MEKKRLVSALKVFLLTPPPVAPVVEEDEEDEEEIEEVQEGDIRTV